MIFSILIACLLDNVSHWQWKRTVEFRELKNISLSFFFFFFFLNAQVPVLGYQFHFNQCQTQICPKQRSRYMTAVLNLNLCFLYYLFVSEIISSEIVHVYSIVDFRSLTLLSPLKMFFLENTKVLIALNCKKN